MLINSPYNEKELLSRIAEGDEKAFTQLYHSYLSRLKPFAEKLSSSRAEAREIIQETFIRLWLNRDKLQQVDNLPGYIFKIAANQYYMALRRSLSQKRTLQKYKDTISLPGNITENVIRLRELQQLIREATQRLPPKRRLIFQMSRNQGMTIREISEILALSPKTVKNALFTALGNIREYLTKAGELGLCLLLCYLSR